MSLMLPGENRGIVEMGLGGGGGGSCGGGGAKKKGGYFIACFVSDVSIPHFCG